MKLALRWIAALCLGALLVACGGGGSAAPAAVPTITLASQSGFVFVNAAWEETLTVGGGQLSLARTGGSLVRTGTWTFALSAQQAQSLAAQVAMINATTDADLPNFLVDAGIDTLTIAGTGKFYNHQFIDGSGHSFSPRVADFATALRQLATDVGVPARL